MSRNKNVVVYFKFCSTQLNHPWSTYTGSGVIRRKPVSTWPRPPLFSLAIVAEWCCWFYMQVSEHVIFSPGTLGMVMFSDSTKESVSYLSLASRDWDPTCINLFYPPSLFLYVFTFYNLTEPRHLVLVSIPVFALHESISRCNRRTNHAKFKHCRLDATKTKFSPSVKPVGSYRDP